jgi:hypothetical protein
MRRLTTNLAALVILVALQPTPIGAFTGVTLQDDDEKRTFAVSCVPKGGLTDDDREAAAAYLEENFDDLAPAPRSVANIARASRIWTPACAEAAQPVPKKLAKLLSKPADGTARFLFDRALVVVDTSSNRILTRVEAGQVK